MHLVPISPIHPKFIIHQTSSLYLRPIIQKPLPRLQNFLHSSRWQRQHSVTSFWSRSLPVSKETKVNYIFYSPRYQPWLSFLESKFSMSSKAVVRMIKILTFTNNSRVTIGKVYFFYSMLSWCVYPDRALLFLASLVTLFLWYLQVDISINQLDTFIQVFRNQDKCRMPRLTRRAGRWWGSVLRGGGS